MLSLKKALLFVIQPITFVVSFFWLIFYIIGILSVIHYVINTLMNGQDLFQLMQTMSVGAIVYAFVYIIAYSLTLIYILIVAKKKVFENPPHISPSFFTRTAIVLLPALLLYTFIFRCSISLFFLASLAGKIGTCIGFILISYLFWAFIISYIEHFNFESVRKLYVPVLKKPHLILLGWVYTILYTVVTYFIIQFLAIYTREFLQWLLPTLLPCGAISAIFTLIVLALVMTLVYKAIPKKGRLFLLASLVFIIPSIILYNIVQLPFNMLMFLVVLQIVWYWGYFCLFIMTSVLSFFANLLAQNTRLVSSLPQPQETSPKSSLLPFP